MALAILEFLSFDNESALFKIDIGTNNFYKLKIGKSVSSRSGIDWVDEISTTSPLKKKKSMDADLLSHGEEIRVPGNIFDRENCYVQLFSFKNQEGRSPAFSTVLKIPVALQGLDPEPFELPSSFSNSFSTTMTTTTRIASFRPVRRVSKASHKAAYARQASFGDLLSAVAKVALPEVLKLISGNLPGTAGNASNPVTNQPANNNAGSNNSALPIGFLNELLNSLLHNIPGLSGAASTSSPVFKPAVKGNRFATNGNSNGHGHFSKPFIFGIDDALLATLAGPLIQKGLDVLPQLINAVNAGKLQQRQANTKLITDLVAGVNNRMMLTQLLQNQPAAGGAAGNLDMNQLLQLLQQLPQAPANGAAAPPPVATTQSLSRKRMRFSGMLSEKAILSFEAAPAISWYGTDKLLYTRSGPFTLKIKLNVSEPAPKNPLPKAIIKFYFKESSSQKVLLEKTFKQKDIMANSQLQFGFSKEEISILPTNCSINVFAEMRWQTKPGNESKALGSTEIVFVSNYFIKQQGKDVSDERELTDMKVYRAFWNKIWESPILDGLNENTAHKKIWELDATMKYLVLLTADHDSNGIIETKMLKPETDSESMTELTKGRMKAGIELSIVEVSKLCAMWDGEPVPDAEKLEAFKNEAFIKNNATEFIYNPKLRGRKDERGMIWVVPVFKLFDFTLNKIVNNNETGQVTEVTEERLRFPLPVSARVIGLLSE